MNAKILFAVGVAIIVWGVVALVTGEGLTALALFAIGFAIALYSRRQRKPK